MCIRDRVIQLSVQCDMVDFALNSVARSIGVSRYTCISWMHESIQMRKSWWSSVQYMLRYLVWYVDFCRLVPKSTETPCRIIRISGPIFTKIGQNVAKILPIMTSKAELRYLNPLRNASMLNKGHFAVNFGVRKLESRSYTVALFAWSYV